MTNKLNFSDEINRDFGNAIIDVNGLVSLQLVNLRRAKLVPWTCEDCSDIKTEQEEPNDDYFMTGRRGESLPSDELVKKLSELKRDKTKYRVFTDLEMVNFKI